jgi:hypothetical protein
LARRAGRGDRLHFKRYNKLLITEQEFALNRIIDRMERDGMHARIFIIPNIANFILRQSHEIDDEESPIVGLH